MKTQLVNLKGGAKLLFNRQTEVNGISVVFSFNAGAVNDPKDKLGVAHFLEHAIMRFPNAKMTREEKVSAKNKFQYSNAFTSKYKIEFVTKTIEKDLEEALDLMTETFASIKFLPEEFQAEQSIIRDEIKTRIWLNHYLLNNVFNTEIIDDEKSRNIISSPAGTIETFNNITLEDLKEFKDKFLTLNNLIITVVGNTNLKNLKKLIKKYVETRIKEKGDEGYYLTDYNYTPATYHFVKAIEEGKAFLNVTYIVKKLPFSYQDYQEEYISRFVSMVLHELTYKFFRTDKNLCYGCNAYTCYEKGNLICEVGIPCSEENLQTIIDVYQEYLDTLPEDLPVDQYSKHQDKFFGSYDFDFMTLDKYSNRCFNTYINEKRLFGTKTKKYHKKRYESVTYDEANNLYKSLFKQNPHIVLISNNEKYKDYKYEDFKMTKK